MGVPRNPAMLSFALLTLTFYFLVRAITQPATVWEATMRRLARRPAPVLALEPAPEEVVVAKPRVRRSRAKVAA